MSLDKLLKDVQIAAVICNQWGDTGKGKITDYLAKYWADVNARGTGGNNAGHTVVINGQEKIYHLLPTGIINDSYGKITVLGNGMVISLPVLLEELGELKKAGMSYNNLMISEDAYIIMPYHVQRDKRKNQSQKKGGIGSTGRGIGPCYSDKIARRGVKIKNLFDRDILFNKISKASEFYPEQEINAEEIIEEYTKYSERIKPFVRDTINEMHRFVREDKKILLEGAQGLLLSIEYGTYPYVTSSDCSLNGTAAGVGLSARAVDLSLGVVKFPFMTRVGAGPFPTELGGEKSERYCAEDSGNKKLDELKKYNIPHIIEDNKIKYNPHDSKIIEMINSNDSFMQGVGLRLAAGEYGATTARPRRTGWTDAVAGRYATNINGPLLVLTKTDCLSGIDKFKICYGYKDNGTITEEFNRDEKFLRKVKPEFREYEGYENIEDIRDFDKLPKSLKKAIFDFEEFTGGEVVVVSVGADREETIVR